MAFIEDSGAIAKNQAPLPVIVDAWQTARQKWSEAGDREGAGDFDTPECEFWRLEVERLVGMIEAAPITSQADAAAMIQFIWIDADADRDDWPVIRHSALASVKRWAEMA